MHLRSDLDERTTLGTCGEATKGEENYIDMLIDMFWKMSTVTGIAKG